MFFKLPAPVKLNLFLHVTALRDDGYHDIQTLFQLLDYGDTLAFSRRADDDIRVHFEYAPGLSAFPSVPERDNTAVRAAAALRAACRRRKSARLFGVDIFLQKRIPVGSGLGGGSSDAATVLHALNLLWQCHIDQSSLEDIGAALGADVPVFVRGASALAEGRGDCLTPMPLTPKWYAVVVPPVSVSTATAFQTPGLARDGLRLSVQDYSEGRYENVFQPIIAQRYPKVAQALSWLGRYGTARLSGSGSGVFASFDDCASAVRVIDNRPAGFFGFSACGICHSPLLDELAKLRTR